ncbi:uncharacterized protein LOC129779951 [Toxorhynchites rutilus septentrionalis]|uniref:uncharacterized protein LOC129779951 n=1 Tax=Toxorhynchites rutilus septentrionalis TaxID=329112 RepID=UPI0024798AA8|nr:uncharacterized protein LOC129779951 [Toxorhynchites rutilus septentrionalis]
MANQLNPQDAARHRRKFPPGTQKLTEGMQQQWNRAIPESDYIQLGTLRYGVRLSNPNLPNLNTASVENRNSSNGDPRNSPSVNSADGSQPNGSGSLLSAGETISNSSEANKSCCCIGPNGIELPWNSTNYARTRLPVPNSAAKNRNSSPSTSASSSSSSAHQQLQQIQNQSSTQQGIRGKLQYNSGLTTSGFPNNRNGINNNNNNNSSNSTFSTTIVDKQNREASPASICCYSNSLKSASNKNTKNNNLVKVSNKYSDSKKLKIVNNKGEHKDILPDNDIRVNENRNGFSYNYDYGAVNSAQKRNDSSKLVNREDVPSGSESGAKQNDGDDLNLNFRNTQHSKEPRLKDVNLNNFKKNNLSCDVYLGFNSSVGHTNNKSRNNIRNNTNTIGDYICGDELSSSSSLSPRSPSPLPLPPPNLTDTWLHGECVKLTPPSSPNPARSGSFDRKSLQPNSTTPRVSITSYRGFNASPINSLQTRSRTFSDSDGCYSTYSDKTNQSFINRTTDNQNKPIQNTDCKQRLDEYFTPTAHATGGASYRFGGHCKTSLPVELPSEITSTKDDAPSHCIVSNSTTPKLPPPEGPLSEHVDTDARLQSLNRYCAKNLLPHSNASLADGSPLDDFNFIDSSDISSTGDDTIAVVNAKEFQGPHKIPNFIPKNDEALVNSSCQSECKCIKIPNSYGACSSSGELNNTCSGSETFPVSVANRSTVETKISFHTVKCKKCCVANSTPSAICGGNQQNCSLFPAVNEETVRASGKSDDNNNQRPRNTGENPKYSIPKNSNEKGDESSGKITSNQNSRNLSSAKNFNNTGPDTSTTGGINSFAKNQLYARVSPEKPIMEKRSNTLDRLQKLVKKTTSGSHDSKTIDKSGTKTERLRELTELLKGTRAPPVPPPRRLRHLHSIDKSFDRQDTSASTTSLLNIDALRGIDEASNLLDVKESRSIDIPYQFSDNQRPSAPSSPRITHKESLRANTSASNLECLISPSTKDSNVSDSKPELPSKEEEEEIFTKLSRPESRTIVGSYTQKTIPFRSASFSQVDYSSGKYIRSALGAIKNSLMRGKENSVIDNVTLPRNRKEFTRSCSPAQLSTSSEPGPPLNDCEIPKLKKTELCINLVPPDGSEVLEAFDPKDISSNRNSDIETIVEDPEAEHIETVENETVKHNSAEINVMQASEMVLEPLVEEGIPIKPQTLAKDEECLQQATTCLIPMPVFDCVLSEWSTARPSEQWVDASVTECSKDGEFLENVESDATGTVDSGSHINRDREIESPQEAKEPDTALLERVDELEEHEPGLTQDCPGSVANIEGKDIICTPPISIVCTEPDSLISTTIIETPPTPEEHSAKLDPADVEIVEVRKRHSNNEEGGEALSSCNSEIEEKRRIDKSKRRKGIYIQWPAIDTNIDPESDSNDNGTTDRSWRPNRLTIEKDSSLDLSGESVTDLSSKDIASSPEKSKESDNLHQNDPFLLDPNTPDSDIARPVWPKGSRRKSLTYQSSDEKEDSAPISSIPVRSFKNLFLRSDSISDNESDRGSSRDRTNASPAPVGEQDLKRYSKRPLRGPYGQMLEAEMKKPSKVHYNEILEELSRHDASQSFPSFNRNRSSGSQSMDETNDRHSSKLFKPRKASANLPLPSHTRTASSPSKLAELGVPDGALAGNGKRLLGNIDQRSTDSDKSDRSSCKHDVKKLSLDSHISEKTHDKASSDNHDKQCKRNSSGTSDKHPKRSLDDTRYSSKSTRTPSERSFVLNTPDTPKTLVASPELLAELLKGSSEKLVTEQLTDSSSPNNASNALPTAVLKCLDTRTHVVVELFNTEKSYVESLQTIVLKYLNQLKSPENAGLVDTQIVDEIFFMVPAILNIHERFLEELRRRLDAWDPSQKIGDAFVDVFSRPVILDTYTSFVNNWNRAKDAIRTTRQKCPAFARFLETMAREHKGKLSLDNLLIKPVQKFPNYELILTRLIKHTDIDHPDQKPLQEALKLVHDILMFLNCKEKEALENGQRETVLRELEGVIEGMNDLVSPDRAFLMFDLVSMPTGQATRKERGFFLFNDLLVITSIKRRSGTIRKTNMTCPGSIISTLDTNKYKFLTKIPLEDLEIIKSKDDNVRRIMKEIEHLSDDSNKLSQIYDLAASLRCSHQLLEEAIKDLQREVQRQLSERQTNDAQLNILELTLNSSNGIQNMTVVFSKPEKRTQWEESFTEAKQKLASAMERSQVPEFLVSVPIRKTRAGLQFTCASPTLGIQRDVWVCNSDGYVGQVCVLSLTPEPTVTSCNGVCNARILCVASVPSSDDSQISNSVSISIQDPTAQMNSIVNSTSKPVEKRSSKTTDESATHLRKSTSNIQLDSDSSSDDSETESQPECVESTTEVNTSALPIVHRQQESNSEDADVQQPTMWLGTEDGCIHVYNCTDNIRIKKNKIKIPHISAVYSILYLCNRVFVSLANGDVCVYCRDNSGWNTGNPFTITVGTVTSPITKLLNVHGKLWCAIQGSIKVLNTTTMQVDSQIQISNDSKPITNMTVSNEYVWISVLNSSHIKCYHYDSFEIMFEVNLAPSVNKMLSNCDDIIRQHKAACLRVTSLMACKDLIWVGTSAGVLLTIAAASMSKGTSLPVVTGIPHGHTGHVRFLTFVEAPVSSSSTEESAKPTIKTDATTGSRSSNLLVISGGDGYEDFRSAGNNSLSEIAGREDSTNHLLIWQV